MLLRFRRLGDQLRAFSAIILADRQILVRSAGRISYIHLRRHHQVVGAGVLAVVLAWVAAGSLTTGVLESRLQSRSAETDALALSYAEVIADAGQRMTAVRSQIGAYGVPADAIRLQGELDALRADLAISERARLATQEARGELAVRYRRLERALQSAAERQADLETELARSREEAARVSAVRDALMSERQTLRTQAARLAQIAQEVRRINGTFGGRIAHLAGAVEDAQARGDEAGREREQVARALLRRDVEVATLHMENSLMRSMLGAMQQGAANALTERNRAVDARDTAHARAEALADDLAAARDEVATVRGVLRAAQEGVWQALEERDRAMDERGQVLAQLSRLERDHHTFRENQTLFLTQLRASSEEHAGVVESGLALTGLDVGTLIEALRGVVDEEGRGGPMLPAVPDHPAGDPAWSEAAQLIEALARASDLRALTHRLPIATPLRGAYRRSSGFGFRRDPFTGRAARHDGLDFSVPRGTPVLATAPGTVDFAGRNGAYGELVVIDHGFGLSTRYAHLQSILVEQDQVIRQGDVIGLTGNTGRSTGPHLHYEVRLNEEPMNPHNFIRAGEHVLQIPQ